MLRHPHSFQTYTSSIKLTSIASSSIAPLLENRLQLLYCVLALLTSITGLTYITNLNSTSCFLMARTKEIDNCLGNYGKEMTVTSDE